jgi:hypothetical protein
MDTKGQTETFFTRHVHLLTFLITIGMFLLVLGPIFVLEAKHYFGQEQDGRPQMKLYEVITLSEQDGDLFKKQLTKYMCEESVQEGKNTTLIRIDIEPHYRLFATTDDLTGVVVYCKLLNEDTGDEINVLEDDVRAYFNQ